jgi:short-subunit dehydrogenase
MAARSVVVITGASAGVGRATARLFAARGHDVGLIARGRDRLESTRQEIESMGARACVAPADVASPDAVEEAASVVESSLGPIDVWVNNAMASVFAPVVALSAAEITRVTEVTYLGVVHGTLAALRRMLPRDRGVIVQVGSTLAYRAIPIQSAYCAAKHAVRGFTDALRSELLHDRSRVHVTMVHLPALDTPQFDWVLSRVPGRPQPLPPIFAPELAARAIHWAVRHRRRELLVTGPVAFAIWLNKIAPGALDWYLARTAYEGQHTGEPAPVDSLSNLWAPAPGNQAVHGRFGDRAHHRSLQFWMTTHRLSAVLVALAGATAWTVTRTSRRRFEERTA